VFPPALPHTVRLVKRLQYQLKKFWQDPAVSRTLDPPASKRTLSFKGCIMSLDHGLVYSHKEAATECATNKYARNGKEKMRQTSNHPRANKCTSSNCTTAML